MPSLVNEPRVGEEASPFSIFWDPSKHALQERDEMWTMVRMNVLTSCFNGIFPEWHWTAVLARAVPVSGSYRCVHAGQVCLGRVTEQRDDCS
jgi:hypothetical protein